MRNHSVVLEKLSAESEQALELNDYYPEFETGLTDMRTFSHTSYRIRSPFRLLGSSGSEGKGRKEYGERINL
jgi:hypothetical protein